jgi:hypothetical protein
VIVSQTNFRPKESLPSSWIYAEASVSSYFLTEIGDIVAKAPASKKAPARRPWTKDDVRTLKGMARKEPASKIAKSLKRTEGATRQKATALGISLNTARKRAAPKKAAPAKKAAPKKAAPAKKRAAKG